ncbi:uncharacterized protein I303_107012 [Kwoniella dejecticola CBS 10117]|uniref:Uncharacterized protein n=1 Tax=Kwoniella dejecticola CBS 10117 TaxID=1296121 RepID=A0A1A5ZYG6_9TREE|nr:uncharacterized protein I303_06413 [Kwoniella dejecticola CBS 10117]OBR82856.1 hypothetical protein I303_06413 [Kwoniella dejecticola CBS 10117]
MSTDRNLDTSDAYITSSSASREDSNTDTNWPMIGLAIGAVILALCVIYGVLLFLKNRHRRRRAGYFWRRAKCDLCRERFPSDEEAAGRICSESKSLGCLPKVKLYHEDCASGNKHFPKSTWTDYWRAVHICP